MAEESTENSKSSEQAQSGENITIPPISKPAAGAAAGAVLGSVGGPVGAIVGGVMGAVAGKAAATGQPIRATAKKGDWPIRRGAFALKTEATAFFWSAKESIDCPQQKPIFAAFGREDRGQKSQTRQVERRPPRPIAKIAARWQDEGWPHSEGKDGAHCREGAGTSGKPSGHEEAALNAINGARCPLFAQPG